MLGAPDGQPVDRVVVDHGHHRRELPVELGHPEGGAGGLPLDAQVHESPGGPAGGRVKEGTGLRCRDCLNQELLGILD